MTPEQEPPDRITRQSALEALEKLYELPISCAEVGMCIEAIRALPAAPPAPHPLAELAAAQTDLPADAARILRENAFELYDGAPAPAVEPPQQCSDCQGSGRIPIGEHFVTRDMAIDGGDVQLEGQSMGVEFGPCPSCGGGGLVALQPPEPATEGARTD